MKKCQLKDWRLCPNQVRARFTYKQNSVFAYFESFVVVGQHSRKGTPWSDTSCGRWQKGETTYFPALLWFDSADLTQHIRNAESTSLLQGMPEMDTKKCVVQGNIVNRSKKQVTVHFPAVEIEWKRGFNFMNVSWSGLSMCLYLFQPLRVFEEIYFYLDQIY